ncbi:MAG: hypothetical protein K9J17_06880 [Flavobacteriales bacterium]|nr:hypothetical protein [Flavobacteriales bacterium]
MNRYLIPLFLVLIISATKVRAQENDTIAQVEQADSVIVKKHSPVRASIMSTALPGLGQVYNGKWWKVPIIYGAFGGLIYSSVFNDMKCRTYRTAYLIRVDGDPNTKDEFVGVYSDANLRELVDFYKRNRDLSLIFTGVIYALNIIDATVDAHLKGFDVSDDLTLKVRPAMQLIGPEFTPTPTFALTLHLK